MQDALSSCSFRGQAKGKKKIKIYISSVSSPQCLSLCACKDCQAVRDTAEGIWYIRHVEYSCMLRVAADRWTTVSGQTGKVRNPLGTEGCPSSYMIRSKA